MNHLINPNQSNTYQQRISITKRFSLIFALLLLLTNAYSKDHNKITDWLYKADINGDNIEELLQINGRFLTVYKPDFLMTPVLSHRFNADIQRIVVGDFVSSGREHGKEQIAAILADGSIQVFAISNDLSELWWWFTQSNFIAAHEHYQVGDFDGDYADEIMVHNPHNGQLRFYEITGNAFFYRKYNFSLGNLANFNLRYKTILIQREQQGTRKNPHIVVIDNHHRQVMSFATVRPNGGNFTFWWAFTTRTNLYDSNSKVYIANVDGSAKDDIIIRNNQTGHYSFYKIEYLNQRLRPIYHISKGQLPIVANQGSIHPIQTTTNIRNRDNLLYVQENNGRRFTLSGSAHDGSRETYWWAYTTDRPFIGSNFTFDSNITKRQVLKLLERHRFAYFQLFNCNELDSPEKNKLWQIYQLTIHHGINTNPNVNASTQLNARYMNINFNNLFPAGDREISQTLIHEMMHCAGYDHPNKRSCSVNPYDCDRPYDGGAYYNSPPLRAELCIGGIQSLTCAPSSDGKSCEIKHESADESSTETKIALPTTPIKQESQSVLEQNFPNPVRTNTTIKYQLATDSKDAMIRLINAQGQVINNYPLDSSHLDGEINVNDLPTGIYLYSLVVNEKIISTKRMVVQR